MKAARMKAMRMKGSLVGLSRYSFGVCFSCLPEAYVLGYKGGAFVENVCSRRFTYSDTIITTSARSTPECAASLPVG
jgi:hypothetical protein